MFSKEKSHLVVVTGVTRRQIWHVWQDINNWHKWDHDIEWARLKDPFITGSNFELKPRSGPKVNIQLHDVEFEQGFTDFCQFPLARMYSIHKMRESDDGVEVSHTIRIEGLLAHLWWQLVGKHIAAGMSQHTEAMIEHARLHE